MEDRSNRTNVNRSYQQYKIWRAERRNRPMLFVPKAYNQSENGGMKDLQRPSTVMKRLFPDISSKKRRHLDMVFDVAVVTNLFPQCGVYR